MIKKGIEGKLDNTFCLKIYLVYCFACQSSDYKYILKPTTYLLITLLIKRIRNLGKTFSNKLETYCKSGKALLINQIIPAKSVSSYSKFMSSKTIKEENTCFVCHCTLKTVVPLSSLLGGIFYFHRPIQDGHLT